MSGWRRCLRGGRLLHRDLLGHRRLLGGWRCLRSCRCLVNRRFLGSCRCLGRPLLGCGLRSARLEWNPSRRSGVEGDLLATGGLVLLYDEGAQPADRGNGGRQKGHQHFIRTNPARVHLRPPPGSTPQELNQTYMDEIMEIRGESAEKSANGENFTYAIVKFSPAAVQCTTPLDGTAPTRMPE